MLFYEIIAKKNKKRLNLWNRNLHLRILSMKSYKIMDVIKMSSKKPFFILSILSSFPFVSSIYGTIKTVDYLNAESLVGEM